MSLSTWFYPLCRIVKKLDKCYGIVNFSLYMERVSCYTNESILVFG